MDKLTMAHRLVHRLGFASGALLAGLSLVGAERAGGASKPGAALDAFVRRLESSYYNVRTLRAQFTQTHVWGGRKRVESGRVVFSRGGRMRWDYENPKEKLFLSDGKKIYLYIPEEKQVTRAPVKSSDDVRIPFRLLLLRLSLGKVFGRIEFADAPSTPAKGARTLRGLPKLGFEDAYREVLLEVTPEFDIRRLVIAYPDQSTMEFTFDRIERNVRLPPSLFRFVPPLDAQIIDQP